MPFEFAWCSPEPCHRHRRPAVASNHEYKMASRVQFTPLAVYPSTDLDACSLERPVPAMAAGGAATGGGGGSGSGSGSGTITILLSSPTYSGEFDFKGAYRLNSEE